MATLPRFRRRGPASARDRLLTPAFMRLGAADLAYFTAAGVAIHALPLYVTGPVGSDRAGAGIAFGAFAVSALVLRPFAGRLADVRGRRPLLLGGAVLCAAAMAATASVATLAPIVALRVLLGVAEAAFFVASFAVLADIAPRSRMGEALSYNSLGLYLGLSLGPMLAELLVRLGGFRAAWIGGACLCLLAAVLAAGIGETRAPRAAASPAALIHRGAIPPGIGFLASTMAMGGLLAFASLQADAVGLAVTSLPLFVYGATVVAGRIAFARVPDRFPPLALGATALAAIAAGLGIAAVWRAPAGLLLAALVTGLGVTFSTPAFFAAIFATAGPAERGAAAGTASGFIDLGIGAGPIVLGYVARDAGIPSAFAVAAGLAAAGAVWTLGLARRAARGVAAPGG